MPVRFTPSLVHGRMGWAWNKPRAWWPPLRWLGDGWLAHVVVHLYNRIACTIWGHDDWRWHVHQAPPTFTRTDGQTFSVDFGQDEIICNYCCLRLMGCTCKVVEVGVR